MSPTTKISSLGPLRRIPRGIWALGLTSMFMDASSEMVHCLLPIYMSATLGANMTTIGLIEGIAEATAAFTKVFSGAVSDAWRRRKPLALIGYGLSALAKPVFPLASSIGWVAAARFVDRIGKGIRGAPRDALIADLVPEDIRGAAYGLRQALDSVGALLGPILAIVFLHSLNDSTKSVLWLAVVPAVFSVLALTRVSESGVDGREPVASIRLRDARLLGKSYWWIVAGGGVLTLARFSEAFLVLPAASVGVRLTYLPVVMVTMNISYAAIAYPAGAASDNSSHRKLLLGGLAALVAADVALAYASEFGTVLAGAALWGLHLALTQGLFAKLVADAAPGQLRGAAFGIFQFVSGLSALAASLLAGILWMALGPASTFFAGAIFAAIAVLGVAFSPEARCNGSQSLPA